MKFESELLVKNIDFSELDNLFLNSKDLNIISGVTLKVGEKDVKIKQPSFYIAHFEDIEVKIYLLKLPSNLIKIKLVYEYKKDKLRSSKLFDKFQSKFIILLGDSKKYSLISNGVSEYYAQRLFPKFQKYELDLRKIFILSLSPLEDENIIKKVKKKTRDKLDLSRAEAIKSIENLQMAELHALIFELNLNPIENLHTYFEDFQNKNEDELKRLVESCLPVTVWEKHFSSFLNDREDSVLAKNYDFLRDYRNDVMHFHTITYRRYQKIDKLLYSVILELEELEKSMISRWDFVATRELLKDFSAQELFVNTSRIMADFMETLKPTISQIIAVNMNIRDTISPLIKSLNSIQTPKIDPTIFTAFSNMSSNLGRLSLPDYYGDDDDDKVIDDEE